MGSESCPYNLKGKETTGDHCPCFTMLETLASVWETKLWFSLHLLSMAFGRLGQMNKTKAMFKIILVLYMLILLCLISLSSNEHMSSCPCSIPQALYVLLPCSFFELLCCFIENNLSLSSFLPSFPAVLSSLLLIALFPPPLLPTAFPHSLCIALICVIAFFLPTAHPLPHKWEQGEWESKGEGMMQGPRNRV